MFEVHSGHGERSPTAHDVEIYSAKYDDDNKLTGYDRGARVIVRLWSYEADAGYGYLDTLRAWHASKNWV